MSRSTFAAGGRVVVLEHLEGRLLLDAASISIGDIDVLEPVSGTANAVFTVQLSEAPTSPVKVNYTTASGTATSGTDFKAAAGTLTIGRGKTSGTISVQISPDALTEGAETFFVNLANPVNATLPDAQAQGTIHDPPIVEIWADVASIKESLGAAGEVATFTVTSDTAAPAGGLPVALTFTGAAQAKKQYTLAGVPSNNTVTIPAGQTTVTFTATAIDDKKVTGDVDAIVAVKGRSKVYNIDPAWPSATVTVVDGEPKVCIFAASPSISEILGGAGQSALFMLACDTAAPVGGLPVTLTFSGTAKARTHYTLADVVSNKVTIPEGQKLATFRVTAADARKATGDTSLTATVKAGKLYGQGTPASATLKITDANPVISVFASSTQLTEAAGPNHSVVLAIVSSVPAPAGGLKVYGRLSGTAKMAEDDPPAPNAEYAVTLSEPVLGDGYVMIPAGATTTTAVLTALDDHASKGNKTIILTANANAAYSLDPLHKSVTVNLIDGTVPVGGPAPEIDVQGKGLSIVSGDTTPSTADDTDFGDVEVNGGSVIRTFTIENTGAGALTLAGNPKAVVSNGSNFSVVTQPTSPVAAAGGTTTFQIRFDPTTDGVKTATVMIGSDDSNESPYVFTIQGTGTTSDFLVSTNQGLVKVAADGSHTVLTADANRYAGVEVVGDQFYVANGKKLVAYDADGTKLGQTTVPSSVNFLTMIAIDDGRCALANHETDEVYFIDTAGTLIQTVKLLPAPDNELQNLDGVQVGNTLVVCEDGSNHLIGIDLTTYATSVFKDLSGWAGWLGAVAEENGTYYVTQNQEVLSFTDGAPAVLVATLPEGNICGIVVRNALAYVTVNFPGRIYRVNLQDGTFNVFVSGLDRPGDIEFAP